MKKPTLFAASLAALLSTGAQASPIPTYLGTYINGNDSTALVNSLLGAPVQIFAKYDSGGGFADADIAGSLFSLGAGNAKGGSWSFAGYQSGGFDFVVTHFVVKGGNDFALYALTNGSDPLPGALSSIAWATVNLFTGGGSAACYNQGVNGTTLFNGPASGRGACANRNPDVSHITWYGVTRAAALPPSTPVAENAPPAPEPPASERPAPELPETPPPYTPPLDLFNEPPPTPPTLPVADITTPAVSEPATLALLGAGLLGLAALRRRSVK